MVDVSGACLMHTRVLAWDVQVGTSCPSSVVESSETYMIQRLNAQSRCFRDARRE